MRVVEQVRAPGVSRVAGAVGPAVFIGAWASGGLRTAGYSPVHDAISRLAAVHASTRTLMTFGMCTFGVALPLHAAFLRERYGRSAGLAAVVSGVATLGVAALPLDHSATVDRAHAVAAGVAYVATAAMPAVAAVVLTRLGRLGPARVAAVTAGVSAASLLATTAGPAHGLFQRLGLTVVDVWLIAGALRRRS